MTPKSYLLWFVMIFSLKSFAQLTIHPQAGISYIEHASTGITLRIGEHHALTALCGTNIFINMNRFSNLFAQYDYSVPRWAIAGGIPRFGVKGGNSIYTNKYYTWKVVSLIPYAGATFPVDDRFDILFEAGPVYSFEQYQHRIGQGDIGHYRYVLLELKVAVAYKLFTLRY